ncbi:MAG: phosphonate ABC transporter substrate-binding protein [Alphaproteobacteria bacterium]
MMKVKLALATAAFVLATGGSAWADWRDQVPVFRVGLLGGENEQDRLARYEPWRQHMEARLGVPVELYPASDYAGVIQGLAAGQLEFGALGASSYAAAWLETNGGVEPLVVAREDDGTTGYYSVMYTLADSGITSIEDMEGKSLAFADPDSTSGYLIPKFQLGDLLGVDPEEGYFSRTGFGGGHEQAVVAVLEGQYDAGVTWTSLQGDPATGYSRGNLAEMVAKGMLDMNQIRIIWNSTLIPNGPNAIRSDLPQELKDLVRGIIVAMPLENPEAYEAAERGTGQGYEVVDNAFFEPIIDLRSKLSAQR